MSNTKHPPTPWHITVERNSTVFIDSADDRVAFVFPGFEHDNAAFIVRACNLHEQLVAALRKIARVTPGSVADERAAVGDWSHFREPESVQIARAALAAAEAA